jgi:hypothetical protein
MKLLILFQLVFFDCLIVTIPVDSSLGYNVHLALSSSLDNRHYSSTTDPAAAHIISLDEAENNLNNNDSNTQASGKDNRKHHRHQHPHSSGHKREHESLEQEVQTLTENKPLVSLEIDDDSFKS